MQHVADKHDLRRDIHFSTRVESAAWDDDLAAGGCAPSQGDEITLPLLRDGHRLPVDAEGGRHRRHRPLPGDVYFTSRWPHEGVDFTGKRVAVIGTGSSAIQSIPIIAEQAAQLTVFQRTPNFSMPANNGPIPAEKTAAARRPTAAAYREAARWSRAGVPSRSAR